MTDPSTSPPVGEHPSAEEIAAYLTGALGSDQRSILEAHLASCPACRQEVSSARRLVRTLPRSRRWLVAVPVAAAAAVLAVGLLLRGPGTEVQQEQLRGAGVGDTPQVIQVLAPEEGDTLETGPIVFRWRAEPGQPLYRLTLTDPSGHGMWSAETSDTTLAVPPAIALAPGVRYFWYVDALDAQGRALTSGARSFWVRR